MQVVAEVFLGMPCLVGVVLWEFQRRVLDLGFRRQGYCGTFEGHGSPLAFLPFGLSCVRLCPHKIFVLPFFLPPCDCERRPGRTGRNLFAGR